MTVVHRKAGNRQQKSIAIDLNTGNIRTIVTEIRQEIARVGGVSAGG
jgi:hypothetical protein